jgi:hypothetical protein
MEQDRNDRPPVSRVVHKKRKRRPLPSDLQVAGDQDVIKTNELQPADLLGEDFAREPVPEAAVSQSAIDLGNKRTQEILGPQAEGVIKYCIQHGPDAVRPGHVATVITDKATEYDPKTMNREPCHVLRFENGALSYLPMSLPGFPVGKVPWRVRRWSKRYTEWFYHTDANGIELTYVTRLLKGRPVE